MVSHHPPPYAELPRPLAPSIAPSAPPSLSHRASSVVSGRSATRRHRHSRSHHGGSNHVSQNEFPIFAHTGDVEITIRNADGRKENRYLLHRLTLSQCSGFFEAGTRSEWSGRAAENGAPGPALAGGLAPISENASVTVGSSSRASSRERRPSYETGKRRWHYELDWDAAGASDMPMLVQKVSDPSSSIFGNGYGAGPPPVSSRPPPSNESFFRSVSNFSTLSMDERRSQPPATIDSRDEVLKDYDNLFRTMYHYAPSLDSINIATAYSECKALLNLADMYDALEIVGSRIDHHLLRFGPRLFKQIAKYPPSYLKLGYLARSRTIFTEALIHVVGQWPLAAPQLRGQVESNIMDLLEDKVDDLREIEERVESKLWRLNLTTSRGERVTPTNDFLSWMALSLFRHWLAENTTPEMTGILRDTSSTTNTTQTARPTSRSSGSAHHIASQRVVQPPPAPLSPINAGKIYRLIGSTDASAYLTHDDLKRFLKTPNSQLGVDLYTRDNLKRFERRVNDIKNRAREAVQPLMRNFLQLDLRDFGTSGSGLGYLTCTRVDERDLPWDE